MPASRSFLLCCVLLLGAPAAMAKEPTPKGKVFVLPERPKDTSPQELVRLAKSAKPEVPRDAKTKTWNFSAVAFFKKKSVQGPITIWLYDKADKEALKAKEPVQVLSLDSSPRDVFVHDFELDPDAGYNKDHVYLLMIGQIIGKRDTVYASGEVKLLK